MWVLSVHQINYGANLIILSYQNIFIIYSWKLEKAVSSQGSLSHCHDGEPPYRTTRRRWRVEQTCLSQRRQCTVWERGPLPCALVYLSLWDRNTPNGWTSLRKLSYPSGQDPTDFILNLCLVLGWSPASDVVWCTWYSVRNVYCSWPKLRNKPDNSRTNSN